MVIGIAGITLGARVSVGMAIAESLLVVVFPRTVTYSGDPTLVFFVLLAIWVAAGIQVLLRQREEAFADQLTTAYQMVQDARDRKAELEEMRQDWLNASRQLALANERMAALRMVAEDASRAKAAFVARVSHEFRTPLNIIIGMINLMVEAPEIYTCEFPPKAMEQLRVVYRNCQHLSSMIGDVLALSQVEAGRLTLDKQLADLADIVDSAIAVVQPLVDEKHLYLRKSVPDDMPSVTCDRTRIRQVVLNLLSNAARLTDSGGIQVTVDQHENTVVLAVSDTGPGITPQDAQRIWEPFEQGASAAGSQSGSGLGLSISRQFVHLHRGRMWLESEPGKGTTFFVELPISEGSGPEERATRWIKHDWVWVEKSFRTEKLGVAQHAAQARIVVCDETGGLGRELRHYADTAEFVLKNSPADAFGDLQTSLAHAVLINADTPERLLTLVDRARSELKNTPVIGCCCPRPIQHALDAGAAGYLTKPVARQQLSQAIGALNRAIHRVLIVDDEIDSRNLLRFYLQAEHHTFEVVTASSGREAIGLLETRPFDLVLVDIVMPDMDGWQFLKAKNKRDRLQDIPVIIISAQDPGEGPASSPIVVAAVGERVPLGKIVACSSLLPGILLGAA